MPNILIAESLDTMTLETIAAEQGAKVWHQPFSPDLEAGIHFFYQPDISVAELEGAITNYNALVVRPKEVTAAAINNAPNLKLIVRGGAGVNSIDLDAAKAKGVIVENTPGQNSISTAEYSFALIMELAAKRQIHRSVIDSRKGNPDITENYAGQELSGLKLGIIGMGNIGQALAKRAAAFDMEVSYYNRSDKKISCKYYNKLSDLLKEECDVISLHIPLSEETENIINEDAFSLMKKGTILINTARPQLINPDAFAKALASGTLESAGIDGDLDVIEPFIKADPAGKCLITHHIADSTLQAQQKITRQVLTQLFSYFNCGEVINRV